MIRRLLVLAATLMATGFVLATPADASQPLDSQTIPLCTDISYPGESGQINVRTSPNRFVAWNIAMYDYALNDGPWIVDVYANNKRVDRKEQDYQPHGSINPTFLPQNTFVSIEAQHVDLKGTEHTFVPNQCLVP